MELIDEAYLKNKFAKQNIKWEYETFQVKPAIANVFADAEVVKWSRNILKTQLQLSKYFDFLKSKGIEETNLSFPTYSEEKYKQIEDLSSANGYKLETLRKYDSQIKQWYEDIRHKNEEIKQMSPLLNADCTLLLTKGDKKTRANYTFWINPQTDQLIKVDNNNSKTTKALKKIIKDAVNGNY